MFENDFEKVKSVSYIIHKSVLLDKLNVLQIL